MLCEMMRVGRSHCAITLAIVKVFPEPVTPIKVWCLFPALIDATNCAIACG